MLSRFFLRKGRAMAKKRKGGSGAKKVAFKMKLLAAEAKGRSLTAADIKVIGGVSRMATSGLAVKKRTPKRIHDANRTDNITWIDADGRDHTQTIDMDINKDIGKRNIP
jgi:hypothetical protein